MKDKIPQIKKYFDTKACIELPMIDIRSRYFWKTEPVAFHDFDTITAINDNHEDELSELEEPTGSDSDAEGEVDERTPMTVEEFHSVTHWYNWNPKESIYVLSAVLISELVEESLFLTVDMNFILIVLKNGSRQGEQVVRHVVKQQE